MQSVTGYATLYVTLLRYATRHSLRLEYASHAICITYIDAFHDSRLSAVYFGFTY